jgi:hypothetical protein
MLKRGKMKNLLINTRPAVSRLIESKNHNSDIEILIQFFIEINHQATAIQRELINIDPKDLTKAEKNILKIIES